VPKNGSVKMNWVSYLINQLEKDFREAQDQGYEFHFYWLSILIAFIAREMPRGATFPETKPSKQLVAKFTMLWYSSDMAKKWQSNAVFHIYYLQLKRDIESLPCMMSNTLHRFRPFVKFHADRHFIYITTHGNKHKEELQSYYKIIEENIEEITNEWTIKFLIPVN
jgi:hypothetical protein